MVVRTGAAAAIPAAAMLLMLALMMVRPAWASWLFAAILICAPLLLVLPVAFYVGTNMVLPGRGYERCPIPKRGRVISRCDGCARAAASANA